MINLTEILEKHLHWIRKDCDRWETMRANLSGADLSRADLSGSNLSGSNLSGSNLFRADLSGANLSGANISGANLSGANLSGANLFRADLFRADLYRSNLSGADLSGADLSGADLSGANISIELLNKFYPICCPEVGSFIGWKKAGSGNYIIKLEIQEDAKRSSAYGRKCRCSSAKVLAIENLDGSCAKDITQVVSYYDKTFLYKIDQIVSVNNFDEDRRNECSTGIHFFITRKEAVDYEMY